TYTPAYYGDWTAIVRIDGLSMELGIWDVITGSMDEARTRPLIYPHTQVILICFAINRRDTLANVQDKWFPEIAAVSTFPQIPVILVGCKKDLRELALDIPASVSDELISEEEANRMARNIGAIKYMECSAKTGEGVNLVFDEAARVALWPPTPSTSKRRGIAAKAPGPGYSTKQLGSLAAALVIPNNNPSLGAHTSIYTTSPH
ncbi:10703_t:CDS:2, partial [Acaulospora colombiana]